MKILMLFSNEGETTSVLNKSSNQLALSIGKLKQFWGNVDQQSGEDEASANLT